MTNEPKEPNEPPIEMQAEQYIGEAGDTGRPWREELAEEIEAEDSDAY